MYDQALIHLLISYLIVHRIFKMFYEHFLLQRFDVKYIVKSRLYFKKYILNSNYDLVMVQMLLILWFTDDTNVVRFVLKKKNKIKIDNSTNVFGFIYSYM